VEPKPRQVSTNSIYYSSNIDPHFYFANFDTPIPNGEMQTFTFTVHATTAGVYFPVVQIWRKNGNIGKNVLTGIIVLENDDTTTTTNEPQQELE
jgi:hypothetical protein